MATKESSPLRARRLGLIEAVASGRIEAQRAVELIARDTRSFLGARGQGGRHPARARLMVLRIRPKDWRFALWLPVPLALVGPALRLSGAFAEDRQEDVQTLVSVVGRMPRCGKMLEVCDQGTEVTIWIV